MKSYLERGLNNLEDITYFEFSAIVDKVGLNILSRIVSMNALGTASLKVKHKLTSLISITQETAAMQYVN